MATTYAGTVSEVQITGGDIYRIADQQSVTNVAYDGTNKKLTKTINGSTTDIVAVSTIKTDLGLTKSDVGLGNVTNTEQAPKSTAVTNVAYDSTNKKLTKTINGSTTDIVTIATIKTALSLDKADVGLSNVTNTAQVTNVAYDSTNAKITKTIAGTTSDVVTVETLRNAMTGLTFKGSLTNFNTAKTTGLYTYTSSATGRPPVSAGGSCMIVSYSSTYRFEVCFINDSNSSTVPKIYVRSSYSTGDSDWRDWKLIQWQS